MTLEHFRELTKDMDGTTLIVWMPSEENGSLFEAGFEEIMIQEIEQGRYFSDQDDGSELISAIKIGF